MVRHNMNGQRATHGVKKVHRHPGSIGKSQFPGHVPKGRRMAGQHGNHAARRGTWPWCGSTPRTTCCWSAAPFRAPTAVT